MQTGHHLSNKSHLHKKVAKLSNASSVSTCGFHVVVMLSFGGVIYLYSALHISPTLFTHHI